MPDPFAQVASPVQNADPFAGVASAAPSAASTDWQKQVKPIDLGNGKTSVQRSDGGVWFGPEQGNTGTPGWFDGKGNRLGAAPAPPSIPLLGRVTPDMSDHDILTNGLGYSEAKAKDIMSAPDYKPGMIHGAVSDPNGFAAKVGHTILGSIYKGAVGDPSAALGQLASHIGTALGLNDPRNTELRDAMVQAGKANYQQNWKGNTAFNAATGTGSRTSPSDFIGQAVGGALPFIATEGKNPATLAGKLISKEAVPVLGKMAAQGGVYGALQPVTQPTDSFAQQKIEQSAMGAAGGVAGGVVGQKVIQPAIQKVVAPVINKIGNAFSGTLNPKYQEIQALADKYGVPISFTDAAQTPILKKTGAALNEIPLVGTGGFRVQQQQAAKAAAQDFAQGFKDAAPAGDWTDNLQGALKDKFQAVQAQKNALYGKVADAAGGAQIPLPKVNAALDAAESDINRSAIPNSQVLKTIRALRANLNPGRADTGQFTPKASDTTFTGLQLTRSDLGDAITGLLKSGQDKEAKVLMGVRNAMNQDMGNFAQNNPGLAGAWKDADAFYKSQYVPLKSKAIQNAMKSATPDEIVNTFIQQGKGDRAANFYSALTPDGQASLRAGLVDRALQNATDGNTGVFSPAKFAGYFDKMDVPISQIFKGEDKWALDGFIKLMRAVQPAGEMGAGPATGNRTILPGSIAAGITGAITMPHTTATMGGLTYGMSKLFTTNAGKRLLMAASDVPVGSPAMNKIVQQITTLLGAQEGAKSAIPLKALIPMAAQNDQLNQPLQITDLRPQVQP